MGKTWNKSLAWSWGGQRSEDNFQLYGFRCRRSGWLSCQLSRLHGFRPIDQQHLEELKIWRLKCEISATEAFSKNERRLCQRRIFKLRGNENWAHSKCDWYSAGCNDSDNWETGGSNYVSLFECFQIVWVFAVNLLMSKFSNKKRFFLHSTKKSVLNCPSLKMDTCLKYGENGPSSLNAP